MVIGRAVTEEPVRGAVHPAWVASLPGLERVRLLASGRLSPAPVAHLFGFRIGHVSPGTVVTTMPASGHFLALPAMDITPLVIVALRLAATTAVPAGYDVVPMTITLHYFRVGRPRSGKLLARARTLNSSSLFVSSDVEVEDTDGRLLGHALSQWAVEAVNPPPPAAPDPIEREEQPTYATPDPPDRPAPSLSVTTDLMARRTGLEVAEMLVNGDLAPLPIQSLLGARWVDVRAGGVTQSMTASPWFCGRTAHVFEAVLGTFLNQVVCTSVLGELDRGQSAVALETNYRFLGHVPADGRELRAQGWVSHRSGKTRFIDAEVTDADHRVVATTQGSAWGIIDRPDRRLVEPQRVLTTLLFTDIVRSTERVQELGDAAWRQLLGEHNSVVRRELATHRGREINTTGDGFLAAFDSPASAVRCAKAIRDGVQRLDLEVRAGVHTGECEVQGPDLAGITVHVAARIMAVAEANDILVSQTVKDLVAGSGIALVEHGAQPLKGVEGSWALYSVPAGATRS